MQECAQYEHTDIGAHFRSHMMQSMRVLRRLRCPLDPSRADHGGQVWNAGKRTKSIKDQSTKINEEMKPTHPNHQTPIKTTKINKGCSPPALTPADVTCMFTPPGWYGRRPRLGVSESERMNELVQKLWQVGTEGHLDLD